MRYIMRIECMADDNVCGYVCSDPFLWCCFFILAHAVSNKTQSIMIQSSTCCTAWEECSKFHIPESDIQNTCNDAEV